jgi:hypothetical protein
MVEGSDLQDPEVASNNMRCAVRETEAGCRKLLKKYPDSIELIFRDLMKNGSRSNDDEIAKFDRFGPLTAHEKQRECLVYDIVARDNRLAERTEPLETL